MVETFPENMFLVEIRLGRTKWRIKKIIAEIVRMFQIEEFVENHPHITLFGPFSLKDKIPVQGLMKAVEAAAKPFGAIPFRIHGYDMNQGLNGAVIAYKVIPTRSLADLTESVAASVGELAETFNMWDKDPHKKWFHITIANRLDRARAIQIFAYLKDPSQIPAQIPEKKTEFPSHLNIPLKSLIDCSGETMPRHPLYNEDGLRVTIVRGATIIAEYDLIQHYWIPQGITNAAPEWQKTLEKYRKKSAIELTHPYYKDNPEIFVISDLHLDHANIIRYCSRPFPHDAVDEMNRMLINNWNYTIKPEDRVFHIGDLCYGPNAKSPYEYIKRLNGKISLIKGNHDESASAETHSETLVYKENCFVLIHNPADAPDNFSGWVIHGHHHNNDLADYPFINFEKRRINVSVEVVRYQPVSLFELYNIIKDRQLNPNQKNILMRGE
jgi:calcineurin-like phosphoesterase family protein